MHRTGLAQILQLAAVAAVLAAATLICYWPATSFGFVALDDPSNIERNQLVTDGLTVDGVRAALTTSHPDYWRPLTWLSLMIDHELHGLDARGYHRTNIMMHAMAAVLLLLALRAMTGSTWRSALVAALFALHPSHVESVAWITERKDVLSAMLGFASLWMYALYVRRHNPAWWFAMVLFFGLGIMSKPSLVPLPFAMLLLDYWPLKRLFKWQVHEGQTGLEARRSGWWALDGRTLLEKIPLFLIIGVSIVQTLRHGGRSMIDMPLDLRLENATVNAIAYLVKAIWPVNLSVYYPLPGMFGAEAWAWWQVWGSAGLIAAITIAGVLLARTRPYLIVGWLWYLGMLAPVIGILQVGHQGMADRFTYLPMVGISIIVAWGTGDLLASLRASPRKFAAARAAVVGGALLAVALCAALTYRQVHVWRDTDTLYTHSLAVTKNNWKLRQFYSDYLHVNERYEESLPHLMAAHRLTPEHAQITYRIGLAHALLGHRTEAIEWLERAIGLDDGHGAAHFNLGVVLHQQGDRERAWREMERGIELDPENAAEYRMRMAQLRR